MVSLENRLVEAFTINETLKNLDVGSKLKHKHIEGFTVELERETAKGFRVIATEIYKPWNGGKHEPQRRN